MFGFKAQGIYSWAVLNEQNKVVSYSKSKEMNMVLNQGLNGIAVRTWASSFTYACVGDGPFSVSPLHVDLSNEVSRTGSYLEGANGTSFDGRDYVMKRMFVFPASGEVTLTEAGFSHSPSAGANLFSKISLPNVLVQSGYRFILQYELFIRLSPNKEKDVSSPIYGVLIDGQLKVQKFGLDSVGVNGECTPYDASGLCNEPSYLPKAFLSTDASLLALFGQCVDRSSVSFEGQTTLSSIYVENSFKIDKSVRFKSGSGFAISSLGVGGEFPAKDSGLVLLLSTPWIKPNGNLTIKFSYSWAAFTKANYTSLYYWRDDASDILKGNPILNYFELNEQ